MRPLSLEAARNYIAGNDFDLEAYEKAHMQMLIQSGREALKSVRPAYRQNLKNTVLHWIENHQNTPHTQELEELKRLADSVR